MTFVKEIVQVRYLKNLYFLPEVLWDISHLLFVQIREYLDILK